MDRQPTGHRHPIDPSTLEEEFWGHEPRSTRSLRPARPARPTRPARTPRFALPAQSNRPTAASEPTTAATTAVEPRQAATIDPILRRAGLLGLAVALLVPVALALRSERAPLVGTGAATVAYGVDTAATPTDDDPTAATGEVDYPMVGPITSPDLPLLTAPGTASTNSGDTRADSSDGSDTPATRTESTRTAVTCAARYEVRSGDSWSLIASRASVTLDRLLAANSATTSTVILVGQDICLPPEAKVSALTSSGSASSTATKTSVSAPPTTLAPAPPNTFSRDQVIRIIREEWPDHLEDTAIMIADRESHLNPSAQNWCCVGLFQIYWNVHKGWLAALGVTDRSQMFDPRTSARAGYALYKRSNSFGAWGL